MGKGRPLSDAERYVFDLYGYVVRREALDAREVQALHAAIARLGAPRPDASLKSQRFTGHLLADVAFRGLIDHRAVLDPLREMCGPNVRLDHAYGMQMAPGTSGLALHGGGTPHDPAQFYRVEGGRMYNGLVAVQWVLVDHRPGDGGFGCVPGSHKAAFRFPAGQESGLVVEVPMAAGDVVIFTEALTHCTIPWRGAEQRSALFYKYAPGHSTWGTDYQQMTALEPLLTERQRRLVQSPSVYPHQPVEPG
ncbi:MAG: Protein involved in biosynthesis of mitomycin antibiotics/polyketide fumonisin [Ilumatobacteraceae bacterium]|nr:Protein involved in biosynthesis of mitomycin antibiotics/polyketide fumonisin [Ilumatobacteraceae bacterium]